MEKTSANVSAVKEKWKPALSEEVMSSEDSEWEEDNDGNTYKTFVIRPIPWQSEPVTAFLHALDKKNKNSSTQKSVMMTFYRHC